MRSEWRREASHDLPIKVVADSYIGEFPNREEAIKHTESAMRKAQEAVKAYEKVLRILRAS